jgi:hypothetical protein
LRRASEAIPPRVGDGRHHDLPVLIRFSGRSCRRGRMRLGDESEAYRRSCPELFALVARMSCRGPFS